MILKNGVTGFTARDLSLERDYDSLVATFKKNCYKAVQLLAKCKTSSHTMTRISHLQKRS